VAIIKIFRKVKDDRDVERFTREYYQSKQIEKLQKREALQPTQELLDRLSGDTAEMEDWEVQIKIMNRIRRDTSLVLSGDNLSQLQQSNFISAVTAEKMRFLSHKISTIPERLWNVESFREDEYWISVRSEAHELLLSLNKTLE
jgi:hypothetical protein